MKEIDFTVDRAIFTCLNCGAKRDVYYTSGFLYGVGLFNTEDGKYYAYINHFDNSATDEVKQILLNMLGNDIDKYYQSNWFKKVFGVSCDPVNGVNIDAENDRSACIACGSDQLERDPGPDEIVTVRFPVVTHENWDRLSGQEKEDLIRQELRRKGCLSLE